MSESDISINALGEWWYDGAKIIHPEVLKLFKNSLTIDSIGGEYFIDYQGKRVPVKVARTPYFIRDVALETDQVGNLIGVMLEVDDGSQELLDPESLTLDDEGVLKVKIKAGQFAARCLSAAHFRIAELLEEDSEGNFFIEINHSRFNLNEKGEGENE
ncbi:DUF1285 domain-containing protein [bacterium]|nr:DUF1285 domain-containing protein [bacterium]